MAKWLEWLEKGIGGGPGGSKRVQSFRWLMLVGLVGVMVMIVNSFMTVDQIEQPGEDRASPLPTDQPSREVFGGKDDQIAQFRTYEVSYEDQLKEIVENIAGVGGVDVMITIESTEEIVIYQDEELMRKQTEERDRDQGTRQITEISETGKIVMHEVSGREQPIIIKTIQPKIRGVVIVAAGAENVQVKQLILETVSKGLDVPAHRISIVPRKRH